MKFKKLFKGRALYVDNNKIWVAKGQTCYAIDYDGKRITEKYNFGNLPEKFFSNFRITRQLFRIGIHHIIPLKNGFLLVTLKKRTLIVSPDGSIVNVFSGYNGNKPGHRGIYITPNGTIFFGEYTINSNRLNDTKLYRSTDNGKNFKNILTFNKKEVCHIHFIQWDKYDKCLWLGTGDKDHECKLLRSNDNGDNWETIGEGSQKWRTIGLSCTVDYVYWGTDAGSVSDNNYYIRMNKRNNQIEIIAELEGPCHGNAILSDGTLLISTGVEGGENEKDRYCHLKTIKDNKLKELYKLKKDLLPFILQYGVIRFPLDIENTDKIIFTAYGLSKNGEVVLIKDDY